MEFRAESFNTWNHTQFGGPGQNGGISTNVGASNFGAVTAAWDPRVLQLAAKIRYAIDPKNPYPHGYTGHVRMTLKDGRVFEERQPHIRGGAKEPLSQNELKEKFLSNAKYGGWPSALAEQFLKFSEKVFDEKVDLSRFRA